MNEAIDRLIAERQHLDQGLPATVLVSITAHLVGAGLAVGLPMLLPREPLLRVADGFAVVLPRGGGGSPAAAAPAAAPPSAAPPAPAVTGPPAPPPQVLKPKLVAPPKPQALPLPDARRTKRALEPPPLPLPGGRAAGSAKAQAPAGGAPGGRGAGAATPGLEFGPPGPGVPDGTDSGGDWYLAGVQQKIWMLWNQQIRSGFTQPVGVTFTIQPDGNVMGVRVTQPSGVALLDMAAQRAILNAAPFGPLPREYGQKPRTIQALFKPAQ
ncbi:MAG TPA: energy transducer TonB [Vicinamibacteria bacterium]|nr:energy transducer TonB [Vicinamibacteria bacterium]